VHSAVRAIRCPCRRSPNDADESKRTRDIADWHTSSPIGSTAVEVQRRPRAGVRLDVDGVRRRPHAAAPLAVDTACRYPLDATRDAAVVVDTACRCLLDATRDADIAVQCRPHAAARDAAADTCHRGGDRA
jgi:hypothetical protein